MKDQEPNTLHFRPADQRRRHAIASLIVGLAIFACGTGMLIGWVFDIPILQTSLVNGRIANPWEVISVLILGVGYILTGITKKHNAIQIASIATALIALCALLLPPWFDMVFFGDKVSRIGQVAYFSYFSASGLLLVALLQVSLLGKRVKLTTIALALLSSIVLINLYSKFYLTPVLKEQLPELLMTLAMSAVFTLVICHAFYTLRLYAARMALKSLTRIGVLIIGLVICVQIAGYFSWSAAVAHNTKDTTYEFNHATEEVQEPLESIFANYRLAAQDYQTFFSASTTMSSQDFSEHVALIDDVRSFNASLVEYIEPEQAKNKVGGVVYSVKNTRTANPQRVSTTAIREALARKQPSLFLVSSSANTENTFFATVTPVSCKGKRVQGAVVTYVSSERIMQQFARKYVVDTQLHVRITSPDRRQIFYESGGFVQEGQQKITRIISVEDHGASLYAVVITAPRHFGLTTLQVYLPLLITALTQILSVLMVAILLLYARTKARTEDVIAMATSELEQERNYALQLHRKDEAIIAGIADGLAVIDKKGRVQLINVAGKNMLGIKDEQPLGMTFDKLLIAYTSEGKEIDLARRPISLALNTGKTVSRTIYYAHASGKTFPAQVRVSPIIQNGEIIGAIELFRDVTKDFELDKAKSEFVALASHQLRTPLSAVNWYGEMLLAGDAGKLNKTQKEYIEEIYQGNKRMISLISDLLDVSRMELGRLVNNPTYLHVQDVVTSLATELENDIATKKIQLKLNIDGRIPRIYADEKMVRIIVQNLMSNAVKYTPPKGSVIVSLRRARQEDFSAFGKKTMTDYLYFSVQDTGYGIPKAQQEKIFQKLFRADNVRRLDVEGTGLGLYMVKEVSEKLGGAVRFESIESIGTTFSVILPLHTTHAKQKK